MIKKLFLVLAIFSGLVLGSSYPSPERASAQGGDPVFVGAGDIASCGHNNDEATAKLLDGILGTVFTLGDNVYPDGTPAQFNDCYAPTWGRHKNRTKPSVGNHDYHTAGASGYFDYFGAAAGDPSKGYYSYNLGAWHIIALNSEIDHAAGSAQEKWLRADLAANQSVCTLAYWHKPRFSSGQHGNASNVAPFWQALYDYGADVVLNGHDHTYERFAPQNPSGQADAARGIREFVVGTGGASLYSFTSNQPNSQVRNNIAHGVLKLTLHATSYDWQFVPVAGQIFNDSGTGNCVGSGITIAPTASRSPTPTNTPVFTGTATANPLPTLAFTPTPTNIVPAGGNTGTPTTTSVVASISTSTTTLAPNAPPVLPDVIFVNNFESGDLSAWSSSVTDNGDLSVTSVAGLTGGYGLQVVIDDNKSIYVSDESPNAEPHYRARFYFDPNSIAMGRENHHSIFTGFSGKSTVVLRLELRKSAENFQLRGKLLKDNSTWMNSSWYTITDASHCIELDWWAATSAGADDGGLTLWIDGVQQPGLAGADNDNRRIDRVRLGAAAGIDTRTRGTYYFAAFQSRRYSYIGPVTDRPIPAASDTPSPSSTQTTPTSISSVTPTLSVIPTTTSTPISASTATTVPQAGSVKINYTGSREDIGNPERGFMKQSSIFPDQPFDPSKVRALAPADTLVWIYFRLDNYRTRPLDAYGLNTITSVFNTARSKGLKLVIRFVYNPGPGSTTDPNLANPDAPIELVLQHIDQLKPILAANADVIAVLQTGFVGHWGEWHSTKYLHPLEDRRAIVEALLDALPKDRMLQLRYPRYKEIFFQGPLTAQEAFSGTDRSRIGFHDDCFLAGDDDGGTYKSVTAQLPKQASTYCDGKDALACWKGFIADEGQFTPVGGETCQYNPPRSDCPNALQELAMLHWSFLNNGYKKEVLDSWTAGGCMETIRRSLGYRLVLEEAFLPQSLQAGGTLRLQVRLRNEGFAAIYNPRPLYVVLWGNGSRYEAPVPNVDPRRWAPGQEQLIDVSITLPGQIPSGTYQLGLWLPDASSSLRNSPAYAVRFANTNVWDPSTGFNRLTPNLLISP